MAYVFSSYYQLTLCQFIALYGGGIAMTPEERRNSQWYFCIGLGDPSLAEYVYTTQFLTSY